MIKIFTSLKLTVTLLAFAIVLVFIGTLAQVDEGLYQAQARYFRQWLILGFDFFGHRIPVVFPGGYLIGTLLLINLIFAHVYRFQLSVKKIGIQLAHLGVVLLLVGQLVTDMFAREMQIRFAEGQTRDYAESANDWELVFTAGDLATAISAKLLKAGDELKIDSLPFSIRVKSFWKNSDINFRAPMMQNAPPIAENGVAKNFDFFQQPEIKTTDQRNLPTAVVELIGAQGSLGSWVASGWAGDSAVARAVQEGFATQVGADMAAKISAQLAAPQTFDVDGKHFSLVLRPVQIREPFSLTLLQATHTVYPGTDIPKDFRSRVRLQNPATGENREVEISMNHPLRYAGLTFYQYQMTAGEAVVRAGETPSSVLQVVRNPSWLTPYIGCALVAAGLTIQFLFHLVGFISKRKSK